MKTNIPNDRRQKRHGAAAVEFAIALPVLFLVVIGLCIAQLSAFRYHQVAALAHESARWASVHGLEYARQNNAAMATSDDVMEHVIEPRAAAMDMDDVECNLEWLDDGKIVSVTVTYNWSQNPFFGSTNNSQMTCTAIAVSTY